MNNYPTIDKLILASASPRRRELLASLGLNFNIIKPDIDETRTPTETSTEFAERLAFEKASAVVADQTTLLIAADTIVVQGNRTLGKPKDEAEAFEMLTSLSGQMHQVVTGVCVKRGEQTAILSVVTDVFFRTVEKDEIMRYIASGCPMDKAGAYAIQGGAAHMVKEIRGSYTNVVGLPLCELHEILISF